MHVQVELDPLEARVFGVLIEKALTTPDQYPLTLNAALNGANQKSNRDPVLALTEVHVAGAISRLEQKYLARRTYPGNSRVEKYAHNGTDALGLGRGELAIVAELLMRGPQTPGELRARASRMAPFESIEALMSTIGSLIERGYVRRIAPAPGSRAERYVQLISPDLHPIDAPAPAYVGADDEDAVAPAPTVGSRLAALEAEVAHLRRQLDALAERLGQPLD